MVSRRDFLKSSSAVSALAALPLSVRWSIANATSQIPGILSDPAAQDMFVNLVPDAMAPGFKYVPDGMGNYKVQIREALQFTGLKDSNGKLLSTPIWGYSDRNVGKRDRFTSWPGKTFEINSVSAGGPLQTQVKWQNMLENVRQHLLPVDTNAHWCYSLPGFEKYSIAKNGVPIITHLHGGHTDYQFDGNPEFFHAPGNKVVGPQWANVPGGFTEKFLYDNDVPAGNLWYHDHALGITRLNVYAGLAGFYFIRDEHDTGKADNPIGLPAWPYEKAYAIQDRMFRSTGELFYPAFPGEPFYTGFIDEEGAVLPEALFPNGGPTALAEFFGDHMVVNGKIWPKENVEQRHYRMHLLNGTDSRFMGIRFRAIADGANNPEATSLSEAGVPLDFFVIGSDQGLAKEANMVNLLMFEPGSRYDIVFDFSQVPSGTRVIMENILADAPFGGDLPPYDADDLFPERQTDRVMAFDVVVPTDTSVPDNFDPVKIAFGPRVGDVTAAEPRKVALFEGKDEFGRLQPLLGAWDPAAAEFAAIPWHMATTETPALGSTEQWDIYNFTGDAHPVHLHLVNFDICGRREISFDADDEINPQSIQQHNGSLGMAPRVSNVALGANVVKGIDEGYVENAPKDMVTALPGQVTSIKATFDKPGRYVWHCHILSHEDHEMMRVLQVV